jgi:hypothetical protein
MDTQKLYETALENFLHMCKTSNVDPSVERAHLAGWESGRALKPHHLIIADWLDILSKQYGAEVTHLNHLANAIRVFDAEINNKAEQGWDEGHQFLRWRTKEK